MIFLSVMTTGIDRKKNRIYLINLYDNGSYRGLFGDPKEYREELESLGEVVTFNGDAFDLPFIEEKTGVALTGFDIYAFLRRMNLYDGPMSLEEFADKNGWEPPVSPRKKQNRFKEYEETGEGKDGLIAAGRRDVVLRSRIYREVQGMILKESEELLGGRAMPYRYRFKKDFLEILCFSDGLPEISYRDEMLIAEKTEELVLRFPLIKGEVAKHTPGQCVKFPMEEDDLPNHLQIVEKNELPKTKRIMEIGKEALKYVNRML